MTEPTTSRRRRENGGYDYTKEQEEIEKAAAKGEEEERKRLEKIETLKKDPAYAACAKISKLMDEYFLDPIIGFFAPAVGDFLGLALAVPFIYVSLTKIKSLPLTLALIFNTLIDVLIGLIPWVGDFLDIFHRSHKKNYKLLTGFVEDNEEIKRQVNKDAVKCGVGIIVVLLLIGVVLYLVFTMFGYLFSGLIDGLSNFWNQIFVK